MNSWYYKSDGVEHGPVSGKDLRNLFAAGAISTETPVRRSDSDQWKRAGQIRGLKPGDLRSAKPLPSDVIRTRLNEYAESTPHHNVGKLGDEVHIQSATLEVVDVVRFQTTYEKRSAAYSTKPLSSEPPIPTDRLPLPDPWSAQSSRQLRDQAVVTVPGSTSVVRCDSCSSKGRQTCPMCHGKRQFRCPMCDGSCLMSCPDCNGSGIAQVERPGPPRKTVCMGALFSSCHGGRTKDGAICWNCKGEGVVYLDTFVVVDEPCGRCQTSGQTACNGCEGNGNVECLSCDSNGLSTCPTCKGKGMHVESIVLKSACETVDDTVLEENKELFEYVGHGLGPTDAINRAKADTEVFSAEAFGTGVSDLSKPIKDAIQTVRSRISDDCRIRAQRAFVLRFELTHVVMTYEKRELHAWLSNSGQAVVIPVSPIVDRCSELLSKVIADKSGEYVSSRYKLRTAFEMAAVNVDCRHAIVSRRQEIPENVWDEASTSRNESDNFSFLCGFGAIVAGFFAGAAAESLVLVALLTPFGIYWCFRVKKRHSGPIYIETREESDSKSPTKGIAVGIRRSEP